jgi:hypothetical protein
MKRAELGLLEVLGLVVNAGGGNVSWGAKDSSLFYFWQITYPGSGVLSCGWTKALSAPNFSHAVLMSFSRAVVKALFLAGSCYCRRLRSGCCMAQILLSSTCKASVGERQRERQTNKGFRASGGYLQKNQHKYNICVSPTSHLTLPLMDDHYPSPTSSEIAQKLYNPPPCGRVMITRI